jgi:hypothetical protein
MSDLWAVPVAVLLWAGLFIMARGAYRRVRADVPVLWLLWRDVARRTHRRLFDAHMGPFVPPFKRRLARDAYVSAMVDGARVIKPGQAEYTKTAQEALRPFFADDEDTWA